MKIHEIILVFLKNCFFEPLEIIDHVYTAKLQYQCSKHKELNKILKKLNS